MVNYPVTLCAKSSNHQIIKSSNHQIGYLIGYLPFDFRLSDFTNSICYLTLQTLGTL